ncbi:MAG: NAD-dependent epimerase/dehydratase family protein, partial [Armatimonadetes bacterium]|nr:NAD-dependent epimerase/dehydratase family protein [Armatimonadota bacterium]
MTHRVDHVYHLAAVVGVRLVVESPVRTLEVNLRGTEVVLKLAHRFGKRVLLASTSASCDTRPLCRERTIPSILFGERYLPGVGAVRVRHAHGGPGGSGAGIGTGYAVLDTHWSLAAVDGDG